MKAFIVIDIGKEKLDVSWLRDLAKNKKKRRSYKVTQVASKS